jgi:hypothetical protein
MLLLTRVLAGCIKPDMTWLMLPIPEAASDSR